MPIVAHGTKRGYRVARCRCDECRAWNASECAKYRARVLDRDGISTTQKYRPARDLRCQVCGNRVQGRAGMGRDGLALHKSCRAVHERRTARRRNASERLRLAAKGVPANPANAIVQGTCRQCGESFAARRAFSGLCSRKCREKVKSRSHWITDAERRAIYERDGWVCQLCFEPVDQGLHYLDNMAASLDHIECRSWALIPDDTPRNLRLAHRICNSLRGDETWTVEAA